MNQIIVYFRYINVVGRINLENRKGNKCSCNANMYKNGIYCEKHYKNMMKRQSKKEEEDRVF